MNNTQSFCLLITTCHNNDQATKLAGSLVEQGLAACVNVLSGIQSHYHWQGKLQQDPEVMLLIKTATTLRSAVQEHVLSNHSYELPELICVPIEAGSAAYFDWMQSQLKEL